MFVRGDLCFETNNTFLKQLRGKDSKDDRHTHVQPH